MEGYLIRAILLDPASVVHIDICPGALPLQLPNEGDRIMLGGFVAEPRGQTIV